MELLKLLEKAYKMESQANNSGLTLDNIYKTMINKFASWRKNYSHPGGIKLEEIQPFEGIGSLVYKFKVISSQMDNPKRKGAALHYTTYVQFLGVKFGKGAVNSNWLYTVYKDVRYYFEKPDPFKNKARIRCSCDDFRHRFAWPNRAKGILFGGPPKKYTKVPGSNRKAVNPENIQGFCKHVYAAVKLLEQNKLIK